jgi:hypothetical protein
LSCVPCCFEIRNLVADLNQYVSEKNQIGSATHGSVPGNDNRLVGHFCDIHFCPAYVAVDASPCCVVDKGLIAVPKSIPGMKNIGLRKIHGDIGVRVSRRVMLKHQSRIVVDV